MKPSKSRLWMVAVAIAFLTVQATSIVHAQETTAVELQSSAEPEAALQPVLPSDLSFGVRAQAAETEYFGESVDKSQSDVTLGAGAFLTYRLGERFALQPEVVYTRHRGKVDHSRVVDGAKDARYAISHLKFPLLGKVYLGDRNDGQRFHLTAGPFARARLSEDAESQFRLGLSGDDLDEMLRTWDYGLDVGLGMERMGPSANLLIDLRYSIGLTNLLADSDLPDFRTRGFFISVGVST